MAGNPKLRAASLGDDKPWILLREVISEYGMTMGSAGNAIRDNRFPVRTYRVGKYLVVDRAVHAEFMKNQADYFAQEREAGLRALRDNKK